MKMIYLSGPIMDKTYRGALLWRKAARDLLSPLGTLSPMRGKDHLLCLGVDEKIGLNPIRDGTIAIFRRDRHDVGQCAAMLVNFSDPDVVTVGTFVEIGWADAWHKPIIAYTGPNASAFQQHPIVAPAIGWWVNTLPEAVRLVKLILGEEQ